MTAILITTEAALAAFFWLVLAAGATAAIFNKRINDTLTERIGLAGIVLTAIGTTCRIVAQGWVTEGGFWLSACIAFYVCAIAWKHWKRIDEPAGDK